MKKPELAEHCQWLRKEIRNERKKNKQLGEFLGSVVELVDGSTSSAVIRAREKVRKQKLAKTKSIGVQTKPTPLG
eukprot:2746543-Pyramimonas_sp.AAC.1